MHIVGVKVKRNVIRNKGLEEREKPGSKCDALPRQGGNVPLTVASSLKKRKKKVVMRNLV